MRNYLERRVYEQLAEYNPRRNALPIAGHDEYEVDYQFDIGTRPLFLFGVKDNDQARLATISCPEFQRRRIPFQGVMAHQRQRRVSFRRSTISGRTGGGFFERERAE